jgi:hypothetical protein
MIIYPPYFINIPKQDVFLNVLASLFPFKHNISHIYRHPVLLIRVITLCDVGSSLWSITLESTSCCTSLVTSTFSALLCQFMGCLWIQSMPWTQHGTFVLSARISVASGVCVCVCLWENLRIHRRYRSTVGWGTALCQKVAGSIPDGVIGIFHRHNPSGRIMALGSTQTLTEISIRNISWRVKAAGA